MAKSKQNPDNGKNIYTFLGIGAVGTLGYLGLKYITDKAKAKPVEVTGKPGRPATAGRTSVASVAWKEGAFPLREGMLNTNKVKWLQSALVRLGLLPSGNDDGDFGPRTAAAIRTAQLNPDNGISINSYNGLLQKAGLPQYMVSLTGEYLSRVPTVATAAPTATAPTATGTTASRVLASGQTLANAMGRLRLLNQPLQFVGLSDALALINTTLANDSDYRIVDTEWRKASGKTLYNTIISWNWSAGNLSLIADALKKRGGSALSGIPGTDSILF